MGDDRTAALPEGTDTIIEGAASTGASTETGNSSVVGTQDSSSTGNATSGSSTGGASSSTGGTSSSTGGGASQQGLADRLRSGREQIASQAGERARGLVTQGLERTSEALANVSKMVGDSAAGIEERLGPEYGDYARRAAGAIENVANTIAEKDPDELIDDTRTFVRNSPGIALAGAAVVGFVVARLLKTGLARDDDSDRD